MGVFTNVGSRIDRATKSERNGREGEEEIERERHHKYLDSSFGDLLI